MMNDDTQQQETSLSQPLARDCHCHAKFTAASHMQGSADADTLTKATKSHVQLTLDSHFLLLHWAGCNCATLTYSTCQFDG